jgi:hypothetical protein
MWLEINLGAVMAFNTAVILRTRRAGIGEGLNALETAAIRVGFLRTLRSHGLLPIHQKNVRSCSACIMWISVFAGEKAMVRGSHTA